MSSVEVIINGKLYKIGGGDNAEEVKAVAQELDSRINRFKTENPTSFLGLSQETLFLFEALSLIAELQEAEKQDMRVEIELLNQKIKKLTDTVASLQKVVNKN
ncbi:MAG: cell division protein ZapA [Alphaproteobacteria bacterium]|jgi:cell division protein ZapA (FtsZ GTPase activity inhibitor)|nr:cell division protein ZapA [Alphaproteobacteria bacterium]